MYNKIDNSLKVRRTKNGFKQGYKFLKVAVDRQSGEVYEDRFQGMIELGGKSYAVSVNLGEFTKKNGETLEGAWLSLTEMKSKSGKYVKERM